MLTVLFFPILIFLFFSYYNYNTINITFLTIIKIVNYERWTTYIDGPIILFPSQLAASLIIVKFIVKKIMFI